VSNIPKTGFGRLWCASALLAVAAAAGAMTDEPPAQQLVRTATDKVKASLLAESAAIEADRNRLYELVSEIILPHFDFTQMSKIVLGKHWKAASPAQQEQFIGEFRDLLIRTYATALWEYAQREVSYLPMRKRRGDKVVSVRTEVAQPGGRAVPVNYEMYLKGDIWQVYDVAIGGISLIKNYRSSFGSEISQMGLDGLIKRLAESGQAGACGDDPSDQTPSDQATETACEP